MAKRNSFSIDIFLLLQLALIAYLIVLGIQGLNAYNSSLNEFKRSLASLFGQSNSPVTLVIAIAEIIAGAALAASLFLPGIGSYLNMAVFFAWIAQIIYSSFIVRITTSKDSLSFIPDFPGWLVMLLADLIILVCLWIIARRKS